MIKIIKSGQLFRRRVVTHDEAVAEMANEPYKLELLSLTQGPGSGADAAEGASVEVGEGEITITTTCTRRPARPSGRTSAAARTCRTPS